MILELKEASLLGRGRTKSCYSHPLDNAKCIKLITNPKANPKELEKELRELTRINGINSPNLVVPQYYGEVLTTAGIGYLFDKVVSPQGEAYPTLRLHLEQENISTENSKTLLNRLFQTLYNSGIVFSELNIDNIMILTSDESGKEFAIVDGFGEGSAIRLSELAPVFAARKTKRKFQVLAEEVASTLARNKKFI